MKLMMFIHSVINQHSQKSMRAADEKLWINKVGPYDYTAVWSMSIITLVSHIINTMHDDSELINYTNQLYNITVLILMEHTIQFNVRN